MTTKTVKFNLKKLAEDLILLESEKQYSKVEDLKVEFDRFLCSQSLFVRVGCINFLKNYKPLKDSVFIQKFLSLK